MQKRMKEEEEKETEKEILRCGGNVKYLLMLAEKKLKRKGEGEAEA